MSTESSVARTQASYRVQPEMPAGRRLEPDAFSFDAFTRNGSVVGGGTVYLRLSAPDGHGALAVRVRVRDALGRALSPDLGTRLWVLRLP